MGLKVLARILVHRGGREVRFAIVVFRLHSLHPGLVITLGENFTDVDCSRFVFLPIVFSLLSYICYLLSHSSVFLYLQIHGKRVCRFFVWYDEYHGLVKCDRFDEEIAREKKIIGTLLRKIDDMKKKERLLEISLGTCMV